MIYLGNLCFLFFKILGRMGFEVLGFRREIFLLGYIVRVLLNLKLRLLFDFFGLLVVVD